MISIVCLTKGERWTRFFLNEMKNLSLRLGAEFVIGADSDEAWRLAKIFADVPVRVHSKGYLESVIDEVIEKASGDWILRLDDDETVSEAMFEWLMAKEWKNENETIYSFPCAWLWGDTNHFITSPPFIRDLHPRFTIKTDALGIADEPHASNICGLGTIIPVLHLHHKFLVKSYKERYVLAEKYEKQKKGAGFGIHRPFSLPELSHHAITVMPVGKGYAPGNMREWEHGGEMVVIGNNINKKAFLVVGPESSGTKMLTGAIISSGAFGSDGHRQPMDDLNFSNRPDIVVLRRSIPHSKEMPNLAEIYKKMAGCGYKVFPIYIRRDDCCTIQSQLRHSHVETTQQGAKHLAKADIHILAEMTKIGTQIVRLSFDAFVKDESIRRNFFELIGQKYPEEMNYYDANEKYLEGVNA